MMEPSLAWATLPVALMVVGVAAGTIPAAMVMSKYGRRLSFIGASVMASSSALLGAAAIWHQLFWLYCLACMSLGMSSTFVQHYRFAAAESVSAELAQQPNFILAVLAATISYALMAFVMTATPVSIHIMDGHSVDSTVIVIQWHIVSMFVPSLFVGKLIRHSGHRTIMVAGIVALVLSISVSQISQTVLDYWISLVALGLGWNFLFVSSTALLITTYQDNEKYRAQAFNEFMVFGFQAIASLSAGWLLSATSWKAVNMMTLPFLGILLAVIWWSARQATRSR